MENQSGSLKECLSAYQIVCETTDNNFSIQSFSRRRIVDYTHCNYKFTNQLCPSAGGLSIGKIQVNYLS